MPKVPKETSLQNLGKKEVSDKFIFCMKISIKVSLKQILSFLVAITRHAQSTQKQQVFEISLQYFKKEGRHEVDFLHAYKQTFLQVDTIKICEYASHAQSTQNNKFAKSLQYLKKEVRDEVHFCTDKHQSIQKVDTIIFDRCRTDMPKVLKITSMQYLCNV